MNIKTIGGILVLLGIGGGIGFLAGSRYGKNKVEMDFMKNVHEAEEAHKRSEIRAKAEELNARKEELLKTEQIQKENGYFVPDEPAEENEVNTDEYLPNRSYGWVNHKTVDGKEPEIDFSLTNISGNTDEYLAGHESPSEDDTDGDDIPIPKTIDSERYIRYIDVDDFESETEYDHEDITYYEEDEVFCDENDKRIEEPDQLFGINAINQFGKNPVNPDDVIFVRNNWFEKVYQITRIHNSYGRLVLGIDEEYPIN